MKLKEKYKGASVDKKPNWLHSLSVILLLLLVLSTLFDEFQFTKKSILANMFCTLINDSSGFLTAFCILFIVPLLIQWKEKKIDILIYLLDIGLINDLYLNESWEKLKEKLLTLLESLRTGYTLFYILCALVLIVCTHLAWKTYRVKKKTEAAADNSETPFESYPDPPYSRAKTASPPYDDGQNQIGNLSIPGKTEKREKKLDDAPKHSKAEGKTAITPINIFIGIFFGIIACYGAKIFAEVYLNQVPKDELSWLFDMLLPLSILCVGGIVFLFVLKWFGRAQKGDELQVADLAAIATIVVLFIIFFNGNKIDDNLLNDFLNAISNYKLIVIPMVPLLTFIILDIAFSAFFSILLKSGKPTWLETGRKQLQLVETGIITLACNLLVGFVNLLLFIPDFLNTIGGTLLDKGTFFPLWEISTKDEEEAHK